MANTQGKKEIRDEIIEKVLEDKSILPSDLFTLAQLVGKGAFGKIYMGHKKDSDEHLAIKVLHHEPGNEENSKKISDEINYLKLTSSCPQMIKYVGAYLEPKKKGNFHLWVIMEYCDCGSLSSYLKSTEIPFAENVVASIAKQILHALVFLTKHGIAHRDLKAANILWNSKGQVKLSDFGEAVKIAEQKWDEESANIAGTPYFMAPEITSGEPYNERVDVWSFGVTLIELAEVKNPYFASPPFLVISQVVSGLITPSLQTPEKASTEFNDILKQCLVYEQEKRSTAETLLNHPFLTKGDDNSLLKLALEYAKVNAPKEEVKPPHDPKKHSDKKIQDTLVVIRDKKTGETMDDFFNNLLKWKDSNSAILIDLCSQTNLGKLLIFEKKGSSSSLTKKKDLKQVDKRLEILSTLALIASKLSSQAFGLIVGSRSIEGVFHEKCFLGKECVDWIYETLKLQKRDEAIGLANHLLEAGLIISLTQKRTDIDTELTTFRFDNSKITEWTSGSNNQSTLNKQFSQKNLLSDEEVAKLNSSSAQELTERDWLLIFSGSNPSSFEKDQIMVKQDIENRCLYRIKKGSAKVEKIEENGSKSFFGTMSVGQMFGEMSVFTGSKTSANIIANESTEIYSADLSFMTRLFLTEPGIHKRFYRYAAIKLAKRLREVGSEKKEEKNTDHSPKQISDLRDKHYVELFSLPNDEVLIQEYSCLVKGLVKEPGTLYISQRYICLYAKVFGKATKTILFVRDLHTIKVSSNKALKLKTKKKKITLHNFKDVVATQSLIVSLRDSQLNRGTSSLFLRAKNGQEDEEEGEILSHFDWTILLREAQCKSFKKNDVIVKEGDIVASISQIATGKCRVEVQKKYVGTMETGEVFGEISFLEGGKASATVIADEDNTDILVIEGARLHVLFFRLPALSGRFYQYLSAILSTRLKEREKQLKK